MPLGVTGSRASRFDPPGTGSHQLVQPRSKRSPPGTATSCRRCRDRASVRWRGSVRLRIGEEVVIPPAFGAGPAHDLVDPVARVRSSPTAGVRASQTNHVTSSGGRAPWPSRCGLGFGRASASRRRRGERVRDGGDLPDAIPDLWTPLRFSLVATVARRVSVDVVPFAPPSIARAPARGSATRTEALVSRVGMATPSGPSSAASRTGTRNITDPYLASQRPTRHASHRAA